MTLPSGQSASEELKPSALLNIDQKHKPIGTQEIVTIIAFN